MIILVLICPFLWFFNSNSLPKLKVFSLLVYIPQNPAYGVYTSRLVSIARACDHYQDFEDRHNSLCFRLFKQGFKFGRLKKQLNKAMKKHGELFQKYGKEIYVPPPIIAGNADLITLRSDRNT